MQNPKAVAELLGHDEYVNKQFYNYSTAVKEDYIHA